MAAVLVYVFVLEKNWVIILMIDIWDAGMFPTITSLGKAQVQQNVLVGVCECCLSYIFLFNQQH